MLVLPSVPVQLSENGFLSTASSIGAICSNVCQRAQTCATQALHILSNGLQQARQAIPLSNRQITHIALGLATLGAMILLDPFLTGALVTAWTFISGNSFDVNGMNQEGIGIFQWCRQYPVLYALFGAYIAIGGPLLEEKLCRGDIQELLKRKINEWSGVRHT